MENMDTDILRKMKQEIDHIDEAARKLKTLGHGIPAVEKNVECVLSAVHNLKFGISDIVDSY